MNNKSSRAASAILDGIIVSFLAISLLIAITGGFQFHIGTRLISATTLPKPILLLASLTIIRWLLFGNPWKAVLGQGARGMARSTLDLLLWFYLFVALFVFLSGGIQFHLGTYPVSARSLQNPLLLFLLFLVGRSIWFGIPFRNQLTRQMQLQWNKRHWFVLAMGAGFMIMFLGAGKYWFMKQGSLLAPSAGKAIIERSVVAAELLPRGFIVWSSNRFGNHDILRMELPSRKISRVTNHPNSEYYSRISPDGKRIIFLRAHRPWVPHRNQLDWDIVMKDLDSGKERLMLKNANAPHWSVKGDKIFAQHKETRLVEIDVKTGKVTELFRSGTGQVHARNLLQTPHYHDGNEHIAITLRGKQHLIGISDLDGNLFRIADGCQITWNKKGEFLYYVDYGGRKKNAIYLYDPVKKQSHLWLDLHGELSHEYFPKLSNDEKYLILGASEGGRKGHEHDTSDYEIFLWQIGTPATKTLRLTHHTGNDTWPDIYIYPDE